MSITNDYPTYQNTRSNAYFYGGLALTATIVAIATLGLTHNLGDFQNFWNSHQAICLGVSFALLATGLHALHEGTNNEKLKKLLKSVLLATTLAALVGLCAHQNSLCLGATAGLSAGSLLNYVYHNPRAMRKNLCRAFFDVWKSVHDYRKGPIHDAYSLKDDPDRPNKPSAVESLRMNRTINNAAIEECCFHLDNEHSKTILDFTSSYAKAETPKDIDNKPIIRIPVVLQHFPENHIIGIIVDKQTKQIRVFDPKGETISELGEIRPGLSLNTFVRQLCKNFGINHVEQNTTKYQIDSHNCGVHVLQWFKGGNLNEDPIQTRFTLIADLLGNNDADSL